MSFVPVDLALPSGDTVADAFGKINTGFAGLDIGSDVQAYDADLDALAALATTGVMERTGPGAFATFTATAAGKALLDDADAATQRGTLGLGDAATKSVGTAAGTVAAGNHTHTGVGSWALKTGAYNAVSGDKLVVDTSGGAVTITLPGSPANGDWIMIKATKDASTNNVTVGRNTKNINGAAADLVIDINYFETCLVYAGTTLGWSM